MNMTEQQPVQMEKKGGSKHKIRNKFIHPGVDGAQVHDTRVLELKTK